MKKLILLFISVFTLGAATFAQRGYDQRSYNDRYETNSYKDGRNSSRDSYGDQRNGMYDQGRQGDWDRINRDYDTRINQYRYDRRMNNYERDRRIQELEMERQQKARAFGKGAIIGGIAGLVLGVLAGR